MKQINWSDHILNFVAVILGVSLAFYISNSAEERRERKEFNQVIQSLIEEIETDLIVYETHQIERNKKQSETIQEVLDLLQSNSRDSLYEKFKYSLNYTNYAPRKVTFNSISASGKFDLIEDFELRRQIAIYHEVWAAEAQFRGESQIDFYTAHLEPWILRNTDFMNPDLADLNQTEIKNMLLMYKSLIDSKVSQYEKLVKEGISLKEDLEKLIDE